MMNTAMMMDFGAAAQTSTAAGTDAWYGLCTDAGMEKPYEREVGFKRNNFHALDKPFLGDEGAC